MWVWVWVSGVGVGVVPLESVRASLAWLVIIDRAAERVDSRQLHLGRMPQGILQQERMEDFGHVLCPIQRQE